MLIVLACRTERGTDVSDGWESQTERETVVGDPWEAQREALGAFLRAQRKMANLSLRQLAELTSLSNPYLSQLERGLHQPSVRVLKLLSDALNVSAETLLAYIPYAADETVLAEVQFALNATAFTDGKPEPAVVRALTDGSAARRAAARSARRR